MTSARQRASHTPCACAHLHQSTAHGLQQPFRIIHVFFTLSFVECSVEGYPHCPEVVDIKEMSNSCYSCVKSFTRARRFSSRQFQRRVFAGYTLVVPVLKLSKPSLPSHGYDQVTTKSSLMLHTRQKLVRRMLPIKLEGVQLFQEASMSFPSQKTKHASKKRLEYDGACMP